MVLPTCERTALSVSSLPNEPSVPSELKNAMQATIITITRPARNMKVLTRSQVRNITPLKVGMW